MYRKLLLSLFILFSFVASAQKIQYVNTYGYEYQRLVADTLLGLPKDTFAVPTALRTIPFLANKSGSLYKWNISTFVWDLFPPGITYTASQGITKVGNDFQLGQIIGEAGNPALITYNREILFDSDSRYFKWRTTTGSGDNEVRILPAGAIRTHNDLGGGMEIFINPTGAQRAFGGINFYRSDSAEITAGNPQLVALNTDLGPSTHHFAIDIKGGEIDEFKLEFAGTASAQWMFNGDAMIGGLGTKRTRFGSYVPGTRTVDITGSYAVSDSALFPNRLQITDSTGFDVAMLDRITGLMKRIRVDQLPIGGSSGITTLNTLTGSTQTFSGTGVTINSSGTNHSFANDLITGKAGGQTIIGGTASGEGIIYSSTSHATKGSHIWGTTAKMNFDEANTLLRLGTTTVRSGYQLQVNGNVSFGAGATNSVSEFTMANNTTGSTAIQFNLNNATNIGSFVAYGPSNGGTVAGLSLNSVVSLVGAAGPVHVRGFGTPVYLISNTTAPTVTVTGTKVGLNAITAPTAMLHLPAGTATANTAPQKFTAGVLNTTPESGAVETNPSNELFYSTSTTAASRGFVSLGRYAATATSITADATHNVIDITATGQTITLPTAVGIQGRTYTIKLTASGTGTIDTTSSQTIDGATTYSLSAQYKYITVMSNNSNWIIIGNN